jgi:hypothetical protein
MKRHTRGLARALSMAMLAVFASSGCEQVDVTTVDAATVQVTPGSAAVHVGGTVSFSATVLSSEGIPLAGRAVTWSSQEPDVASVDASGTVRGIAPGTARIQASSEGASGFATVTVTAAQPVIAVAPSTLSFTANQGSGNPPPRTVAITEATGAPLSGLSAEIAYPIGQPAGWVSASLDRTTAPASLVVGVLTGSLAPGTYTATVRVHSATASNTPQSLQIEFVVAPPLPAIALSPSTAAFAALLSGGNPAPIQIGVTNSGGGIVSGLSASITYTAGQPQGWLTAALAGNVAPTTLTLSVAKGSLPIGTYSAVVRLNSTTAANAPVDIPVTLNIANVAPGPPQNLQAEALSSSRIALNWSTSTGGAADEFRIERRPGAGGAFVAIATVGGSTLSYEDAGLTAGTQYTYRVAACNEVGCSAPSNEATATTGQVAPGAPSNLQAAAVSATQINLSWTAASGTVARYRVERRAGSGAFAVIDSVGGGTLVYQDTGLAAATQYTYRVTACNAVGCSAPSNEATATTGQVAPGAPSSLQVSAASASQINLSWTAASGTVARYRIERRTGGGAFAVIDSVGSGTLTYQDTGLAAATQYTYRVAACNQAGCSAPSNEASATTGQVAPGSPSNLQANAVSASQINLSWTAASGTVAQYRIERRTGGGAYAMIDSVAGATLNYQNTGLAPATQYTYRVAACNAGGCSAPSNEAAATTHQVPPGAPSNLQATAVSASRIDLSWTAASGTVALYRIERRTGGGAFAVIASVGGGTLSYQDTGLVPATEYTYRVDACNDAGCSAPSGEASATTLQVPPGTPANLQANAVSASRIDLSWTAASGTVALYRIERRTGGGAFAVVDSVGGATLSYQDTGLVPATQYTYRVAACNSGGCSAPSSEASATTNQVPPGAPSNLQANAVSAFRIDLGWTAASGTVALYRIERRTGGGAFAVIDSVGGATLTYQDTGLTPATAYTYRVTACNEAGCSVPSGEASATTHQVPPGAPANLQANAVSAFRIDLSWTAASGTVELYRIERRTGGGAFAVIDSVGGGTLSYQDTGLTPATAYTYRVTACNEAGCSAPSGEASATTHQVPPGAPSNLQANAVSSSQINLSWTAASGTVELYRIERRTGGGAFAVIDSVGGGTLNYQDTGLAVGTQYTYRVVACNEAGCSAPSNEASATTGSVTAPAVPGNVSAQPLSSTEVRVTWTAPGGQLSYQVRMRQGFGGAWNAPAVVAGNVTSYNQTGLQPGTAYQFQVAACNGAGCSEYSSPAAATTLSGDPEVGYSFNAAVAPVVVEE